VSSCTARFDPLHCTCPQGLEEPRLAKDPAYVLAYHQFLVGKCKQ
jgi:hypothetical protein